MSPKSPPLAIAIILTPFMSVISTALAPWPGNCCTGWLENLNITKSEFTEIKRSTNNPFDFYSFRATNMNFE